MVALFYPCPNCIPICAPCAPLKKLSIVPHKPSILKSKTTPGVLAPASHPGKATLRQGQPE